VLNAFAEVKRTYKLSVVLIDLIDTA